ncbi:MAG: ChbG/HpnK family deacetylase [Selenomonadaceae bacterium]|nr:ChbG/HpnK family deacetylase [Selenomonadaceae bacterium]
MKKIIMNADDFGRHELINLAVKRAVENGCLRSATLMAGGVAFDDAVTVAKNCPLLGVGIHFTLANGNPILPPEEIPSLVTAQGFFHADYVTFLKRYFGGKISLSEVRSELSAQLNKIRRTGLKLTHVDSHQHLHHIPGITEIILELADDIKAMRVAGAKLFDGELKSIGQFVGRLGLSSLAKIAAHKAHKKNFVTPEHFAGIVAGEAVSENFMLKLIENLGEGTTEVMLHPGTDNKILCDFCEWNHDFEEELNAVTSPRVLALLDKQNISAVNFSALHKD